MEREELILYGKIHQPEIMSFSGSGCNVSFKVKIREPGVHCKDLLSKHFWNSQIDLAVDV